MNSVKVSIYLVDGGLQEFNEGSEFLIRLRTLQSQGLAGKQLVHRLITDDWGVPPRSVEINGKDLDGKTVETRIPYI